MRFRRNPLPRRLLDGLCFLLTGIYFPFIYIFEVVLLFPVLHDPGSINFNLHVVFISFVLYNIVVNMWATMIMDTSVNFKYCATQSQGAENTANWRHCNKCASLAPPRSWHCRICRVCVLKSDHHCIFIGCCIGHLNQRYYICFIFYMFISAVYATVYLTYYFIYIRDENFIDLVIDTLNIFGIFDPYWDLLTKLHRLCLGMVVIQMILTFLMLAYHMRNALLGQVCWENGKKCKYNKGRYRNLRSVFGQRMHLVWLCPFVKSPLPEDGYSWKSNSANFKALQ